MNPQNLRDDLLSEVMLVVCQLEEGRLFKMHEEGYLKYYVIRTILNMMRSNDSTFYNKFRLIHSELNGIDILDKNDGNIYEELIVKTEEFHTSLPFYENALLKSYVELNNNAKKLSKETGIPVRSIYHTLKAIKGKAKMIDKKQKKIKFNIECEMKVSADINTDDLLDLFDEILKSIMEMKYKKFKPICLKIQ
jgi:hypothetical protein